MRQSLQPSSKLDEVVLGVLAAQRKPELRDDDRFVSIEFVHDDEEDAAVTGRFAKHSMPYERVEIEPLREKLGKVRSNQFARTIRVFDPAWFDKEAVDEYIPPERRESWWWLVIALAAAWVAVAVLA